LFTSQLPSGHRVGHLTTVLGAAQTTLAERFHAAGWRTGIFCANTIVGPEFGFAQGAEIFRTLPTELVPRTKLGYALFRLGEGGRRLPPVVALRGLLSRSEQVLLGRRGAETLSLPAAEVVRDYDAWRAKQGDDPCFAYLHVMEPHAPYEPPADLAGLFAPLGEPLYANPPAAIAGFPPFARGDSLAPDRVAGLVRAYDAEIRGVDRELGALFAAIAAARRPTILAVTADHGEEFFEHGGWRHGQSLHAEMLDVPLVLVGPGVPVGRRAAGGQLIDLGPTLLELCGLPAPDDVSGRSLVPQLRATAFEAPASAAPADATPADAAPADAAPDREAVAEIVYGDAYWSRSLTRGPLKVIQSRLGSRDALQLFDLRADPGESRDLAAAEPALASALRTRLEEVVVAAAKGAPEGESADFDAVTRERLRALGYVQ
jgi:arylsulfatase A-like enzyme